MSDFVDFKKRSVDLPAGCKDLIDVLVRRPHRPTGPAGVPDGEEAIGMLADSERYCRRIFEAKGIRALLVIRSMDGRIDVRLFKMMGAALRVFVAVAADKDQETAILKFLDRHGLQPPRASVDSTMSSLFYPNVPVQIICDLSPVPSSLAGLVELMKDFFREVCGAREDTQAHFYYGEMSN